MISCKSFLPELDDSGRICGGPAGLEFGTEPKVGDASFCILLYIMLFYMILCRSIVYGIISCGFILYHSILSYIILCCIALSCIIFESLCNIGLEESEKLVSSEASLKSRGSFLSHSPTPAHMIYTYMYIHIITYIYMYIV